MRKRSNEKGDVRITNNGSKVPGVRFMFYNEIENLITDSHRLRILPKIDDDHKRIYFCGIKDTWMRTNYKELEYSLAIGNKAGSVHSAVTSPVRKSIYDFTAYTGAYDLKYDAECKRYYIQVAPEKEKVVEQPKVITDAPAIMSIKDFDPNAIYEQPVKTKESIEPSSSVYYTITNETMSLLKRNLEFLGYSYDDLTTVDLEYEQRKKEAYKTYLKLKEEFGFD